MSRVIRGFVRPGGKTSYRLVNGGPGVEDYQGLKRLCTIAHVIVVAIHSATEWITLNYIYRCMDDRGFQNRNTLVRDSLIFVFRSKLDHISDCGVNAWLYCQAWHLPLWSKLHLKDGCGSVPGSIFKAIYGLITRIFWEQILLLCEISDAIKSQCSIFHGCWAVVSCAKFWLDWIIRIKIRGTKKQDNMMSIMSIYPIFVMTPGTQNQTSRIHSQTSTAAPLKFKTISYFRVSHAL